MIVGVDAGSPGPREAEHLLHEVLGLLPDGVPLPDSACTHVVAAHGYRHVLTFGWDSARAPSDVAAVLLRSPALAGAGVAAGGGPGPGECLTERADFARLAVEERRARAAGRLVRFAGQGNLVGRLSVDDVVARSAVDAVEGLAGVAVRSNSVLDTRGWVRPNWRSGRVVLLVQAAAAGELVPFELEEQVACCDGH